MRLNDPCGQRKSQLLVEGAPNLAAVDAVTQRITRMASLFIAIAIGLAL